MGKAALSVKDSEKPLGHVVQKLRSSNIRVRENIQGGSITVNSIGGYIKALCVAETIEQVITVTKACREYEMGYLTIGAGSNIVLPDEGIERCLVVKLGKGFKYCRQLKNNRFEVGGGTLMIPLSYQFARLGYSGLEFAGGIPATFGGAVRMNAGAHGMCMADIIEEVMVVLPDGSVEHVPCDKINFSYRRSELPKSSIIVSAKIKMVSSDPQTVQRMRSNYLKERRLYQPITLPSSGSVFKNPNVERIVGVSNEAHKRGLAGRLIELAGLKGVRMGGAKISEKHGNWIVNESRKATARDFKSLVKLCQQEVYKKFNVWLEPEVIFFEDVKRW